MTQGKRRIDRILDPSFLDGIAEAPLETLRQKRDECDEEESIQSYERRLIHGRLAILEAEKQRRVSGGSPKSLIDRLPEILAGDDASSHRGSFPKLDAPHLVDHPRRRVEKLVADDTLARLTELSDAEIADAISVLQAAERDVSESRKAVLAVLDPLIEEIARRKAGVDV